MIQQWATKHARAREPQRLLNLGLIYCPDRAFLEALRQCDEAIIRALIAPPERRTPVCSTLGTEDERPMPTEGTVHG